MAAELPKGQIEAKSPSVPRLTATGNAHEVVPPIRGREKSQYAWACPAFPLNGQRLPRLNDVAAQLLDQVVAALKRARVAQPAYQIHRERLAVQIALEAD